MRRALQCAAALVVVSQPVLAQDAAIEPWGWARVRYDRVEDLPGGRDDFDRGRLHGYVGARWIPSATLELGAALKVAAGTDDNSDNLGNFDNEESDGAELGELYLRWFPSPQDFVEIGRAPLPLALSPMVWDHDFRPVGASWQHDFAIGSFDRFSLLGGHFAPLHIDESESRLTAVQAAWHWREGAPVGFDAALAWLDFGQLDELTVEGRTRTNSRGRFGLIHDYRILDLLLEARLEAADRPLLLTLDLATNTDADDDDQAARFSARWGDARRLGGWELGYAIQRIQRDAVMAAFNEDDWWFASASRGTMPWVGYGFNEHVRLRVAAFFEQRDGLDEQLERLMVDVVFSW